MSLPKFEYFAPKTLARAISLQKDGGQFLAGGTDLFVAMKQRICRPERLIDLGAVSGLKKIQWTKKDGLRIGAGTTLTHLEESPHVRRHLPALSQIISLVSTSQLRNMGTVGGNLCLDTRCYYYNQPLLLKKRWEPCLKIGGEVCHVVKGGDTCFSVYSGDMAAPLMALGARVKVVEPGGARELDLKDLFSGSGVKPNILKSNEILSEIVVPNPSKHSGLSYQKLRLRDTMDFPLLGIAVKACLDEVDGQCRDFRIVVGATGPAPMILEEAGEIMCGKIITLQLIEEVSEAVLKMIHPVANTAAEPRYRRQMVPVLMRQAVYEALSRIRNARN
jgi:4-hydroxybenzoyl-CoA reductase subunit beta